MTELVAVLPDRRHGAGRGRRGASRDLNDLRERYRADLGGSRSRAPQLVDLMFANPVVTARRVSQSIGMSTQGALKLIRQLEARGWLTGAGSMGRGGRNYWVAQDVYAALSDPTRPQREPRSSSRSRD